MTRLLDIGVTGLNAHQRALVTTGQNITNAGVEGYSRQEVSFTTQTPQFKNGVFVGSGVTIDAIRRITDEFLVLQSYKDASRVGELEALDEGLRRLDQLVSSEETGLTPAINELFASIQGVAEAPSSVVLREQVLNNADSYLTRFDTLVSQIEQVATQVDAAIAGQVGQINNIADSIAELNRQISLSASLPSGSQPNDLLDKREQLLRQLSHYMDFTTTKSSEGAINVFIAGGQALVLDSQSNPISTISSGGTGNRLEIVIQETGVTRIVTDKIRSGEIGGLLQLRDSGLDSALNQLGLMQTTLSYAFNSLHSQGVDLNGTASGDFFTSINDRDLALGRAFAEVSNVSDDAVVSVTLDEPSLLTASDYSLRFNDVGSLLGFQITRLEGGVVVGQGAVPFSFPQQLTTSDGFTVNLEEGTFQAGDQFTLRPTRVAAGSVGVLVANPESLALGLPVSSSASPGNLGQGVIQQVEGLSTGALSVAEQQQQSLLRDATPPLVVRFTSATTYDILDNTDPAAPVDLVPPLRNLSYLPGQVNPLLDVDPLSRVYTTTGAFAFTASPGPIGATDNGYPGETITFTSIDPGSGDVTTQNVVALGGESAASVASRINAVDGMNATANTELSLTIADDGTAPPLELRLNGIELTSTIPGPVPSPVDANFLAARINSFFSNAGVFAQADGGTLTIRSVTGEDLTLENFGAGADSISLTSVNESPTAIALTVGNEVTVGGTVSVVTDRNTTLISTSGYLAGSVAQSLPAFIGYDIAITGQPETGDEFFVNLGSAGVGDNRNALALAAAQTADVLSNGFSIVDIYATLVGDIGGNAGAVAVNLPAAQSILTQTDLRLDEISGVNLDEEAAKLLQYEQAYNASARIISIARTLFDSLLGAFV